MYKLQREIASIQQSNNSLTNYFNKLKKLWKHLNNLRPLPNCNCGGCKCGLMKTLTETYASTKTIQLLIGLNESFDAMRNQILMQEPLPNVNRAYATLQNVESQR